MALVLSKRTIFSQQWFIKKQIVPRTLTRLAGVFNKCFAENSKTLPSENVGILGIPELKSPEGFYLMKESVIRKCSSLIEEAIRSKNSPNIVSVFDEISDELCKVADLAEFLRLTHPSKSFSRAAEETSLGLGAFVEQLNTNIDLYHALKHALSDKDVSGQMDDVTKHVGNLFLFDFEQSGIHLKREKRERAVKLHEMILAFGAEFSHNTSAPNIYPLKKWPADVTIPFKVSGNEILVSSPSSESANSDLRKEAYKAFYAQADGQLAILENLLACRNQLANLLGFESYSHRALKGTMAQNPETVEAFLSDSLSLLRDSTQTELDIISGWKSNENEGDTGVHMWDIRYYTSKIISESFTLSAAKLSEYFSLGACMDGLNMLFTDLYGVHLNHVDADPGEVWSDDVQKLEVRHESEGVLGYIYCDFFSRPGKINQDCHFTIRGGKQQKDGRYQLPVVCLVCNFPPPTKLAPPLLTIGMVENLFHEMGHAMHSMLARTRYQHVTGTRCSTDFAEVPSVLMESFALDPRVLRRFAKHYATGQSLSEEFIEKLHLSRTMFTSLEATTQAFYAIVDQVFHGKHPLGKSTTSVLAHLHNAYFPIPYVKGTAWQLRFSHFHSYGAKYYSYLWSKAVAALIWSRFFKENPFCRESGERFRRIMLAHGGGKPPQLLVNEMLDEEISPRELVKSLRNELKI